MADPTTTTESTEASGAPHEGGLPQMNVETFAGQLFWLAITFGFLLVVLSKVVMPRIGGTIEARAKRIQGDLDEAERLRKESSDALAAYEAALAQARARANALAEENRKKVNGEIEQLKAQASEKVHAASQEADARIAQSRTQALSSIRSAAADAAQAIVERLLDEQVSEGEVAKALEGSGV